MSPGRSAAIAALLCTVAAVFHPSPLHAQRRYTYYDSTYGGLLVGIHGFARTFAEVGLARIAILDGHDSGDGMIVLASSLMISPGDRTLMSAGTSGWVQAWLLGVGWGFTYYTDLHEGSFRFTPQLLLALNRVNVAAGMVIPLTNPDFQGIPKGELIIRWTLPLWGSLNRQQ